MKTLLFNTKCCLLFGLLFLGGSLKAQSSDSAVVSSEPTIETTQPKQQDCHKFRPLSYAIPALMLTYGIVSLENHELVKLNHKVKEEVWEEGTQRSARLDDYIQYSPAVAVYALNLAGVKGKNNLRDRTMIYAMSNLFAYSMVYPLKKFTHELRPDGSSYESFPSGHTAEAFLSAEFLRQEYKDVSPWYGLAGYTVAATTGFLRVYNNKHWLSDVIAGAGIGIASAKLTYYVYPYIQKKIFRKTSSHAFIMPYYQGTQGGFSMVYSFY